MPCSLKRGEGCAGGMCRHWLENPLPDLGAKLRFLDPLTALANSMLQFWWSGSRPDSEPMTVLLRK